VDHRTDIWTLGVILHELLAGSVPFDGETILAVGGAILHSPPTPIENSRADLPPALVQIILTCLHKKREVRFQTIGELTQALREFAPPNKQANLDRISRLSLPRSRELSSPQRTVVTSPFETTASAPVRASVDEAKAPGASSHDPAVHPAEDSRSDLRADSPHGVAVQPPVASAAGLASPSWGPEIEADPVHPTEPPATGRTALVVTVSVALLGVLGLGGWLATRPASPDPTAVGTSSPSSAPSQPVALPTAASAPPSTLVTGSSPTVIPIPAPSSVSAGALPGAEKAAHVADKSPPRKPPGAPKSPGLVASPD
jgi:serine/threonine-protein kinase